MNLGYMMIPQRYAVNKPLDKISRAKLALRLGFSEFYASELNEHPSVHCAFSECPETADMLQVLPDLPELPTPHVVSVDGQRQNARATDASHRMVKPAESPEQVKTNSAQRYASLSASWLRKSQLAEHWAAHVTGSTHAGLRARPEDWHVARTILINDNPAHAEAAIKSDDSPCRKYYSKMANLKSSDPQVDALIDECVLYGTLQSVLDALDDIVAATGPFGTLTLVDHVWPDAELAARSISSLASAIAPMSRLSRAAI